MNYSVKNANCLSFLAQQPPDSVDLVFGSPPYEDCRTYGIDFNLKGQAWVDWMVEVYLAASRCCKGLVAFVVEGKTKSFQWSATPALLMADLHRAGMKLRKPPVFHRVGIAGSGGPDWLRNDFEFIVCTSRGKLPWSDNTAMGHAPKWAPGGEMSHRLTDGARVNQWEKPLRADGNPTGCEGETEPGVPAAVTKKPSHKILTVGRDKFGSSLSGATGANGRDKNGIPERRAPRGTKNGDMVSEDSYDPPAIANPGNVIKCKVGGGVMGNRLCHENEAPFPELLAEWFVRSFCPPGGIVIDPFAGSGTTGAVAIRHERNFLGCDIRQSQVALAMKRIGMEAGAVKCPA